MRPFSMIKSRKWLRSFWPRRAFMTGYTN
jgi:hypothetical protein